MNKKTNGILMGLFLGLIGLAIGLGMCNSKGEKEEFISGWWIGFIVCFVVFIILGFIYYFYIMNIPYYY
ncbi:MAG: hypothetical protein PHR96_04995 [Clostridia bacterium]|nr:hypothetical protein [Clostridia bacterium]MDD3397874.1 hypothetical protein [Clostridia bacterium]